MSNENFYTVPADQLIALDAYGEAASEGTEGLMAVINVIKNRAMQPSKFADQSIYAATNSVWHAVILKPYQFSVFNANDPGRTRLVNFASDFASAVASNTTLSKAYELARTMLAGGLVDNTGGATYYHANYVMPSWASTIPFIGQIGNHLFYGYTGAVQEVQRIIQENPVTTIIIALILSGAVLMIIKRRYHD